MLVPHLIFVYNYLQDENDNALGLLAMAMVHLNLAGYLHSADQFIICEQCDFILHDIPPQEEGSLRLPPPQHIRFSSWSDQECYDKTNFTKDQLVRIYRCFVLAEIARISGGSIRVPTGHTNQRGVQCCYLFHPEELFLYTMMRMKTGDDHTQMCYVFGGSIKKWSYAWHWIMVYLDKRYENIIGHQGLLTAFQLLSSGAKFIPLYF
jgi:hypothetical protein